MNWFDVNVTTNYIKEETKTENGKLQKTTFFSELNKVAASALTKEQEMEQFKQEFWAEVAGIPKTSTIDNLAIHITDKGWERMKEEPEYREKMMGLIKRDTTGNFICQVNSVITIGADEKEYHADSWSSQSNKFWQKINKNSYMERRKKRKKELQEYYDKLWEQHFYEQKQLRKKMMNL